MKRYMLFTGDNYYPAGGVEDFVRSFDSMEAITQHFMNSKELGIYDRPDWANAIDIVTGTKYYIDVDDGQFMKM